MSKEEQKLYTIPVEDERPQDVIKNVGTIDIITRNNNVVNNSSSLGGGGVTEQTIRDIVGSMMRFNTGQNVMMNGLQRSQNFVTGLQGWQIDAQGNAEFNNGTFRGTFNIGGTTITINNTQDIQTYLDTISTAGGGILFLQNGTYLLTADILIPSGVGLKGVSRDGVIIDCNTSYAVKIAGTNVYSTGTVTINNGAITLEGSGTTWTAAMVGRYVLLDGLWYEITARTDNDTVTITNYEGVNLAGSTYVLADTNFSATIKDITITGATSSGLVVQYAMECQLDNLIIYDCGTGIDMDYVTYPKIEVTSAGNGVNLNMNFVEGFFINFSDLSLSTTGAGIIMTNTRNATYFNSSTTDNTGDGINMTACTKIAFISFDISGNGGQGIEFVSGCDDNQMTDGIFDGNASDNIKLTATSDRNQFVGVSSINAGGYGINIAASTCDNNVIVSPSYSGNSSGTLNDSGTNTVTLINTKSSTYTPSATNVTNITSSTPNNASYQRVGDIVNVFGTITVTNTLAVASEVDVSLPIASNLAGKTDLNGTATMDTTASTNIYINGDSTNDRASIFFTSVGVGNTSTIYYSFSYKVI